MTVMEKDGFILVRNKKTFKQRNKKLTNKIYEPQLNELTFSSCVKRIEDLVQKLKNNSGCKHFIEIIAKKFQPQYFDLVVVYGLGRLSSCDLSREQFSFLLILQNYFKVQIEAFDPIFSNTDKEVLKSFNIVLLTENEQCKRVVKNKKILFYMIHCDIPLYEHLLSVNWCNESLQNLCIIGNSLINTAATYTRVASREQFESNFKHIIDASAICKEISIPRMLSIESFNECSLITFETEIIIEV